MLRENVKLLNLGKAKSVKELREVITEKHFEKEIKETLEQPTTLLKSQMPRLGLKGKSFRTFEPASPEEIDSLWNNCIKVDSGLNVKSHTFYH